ncbi:nitrate/nitrite transporter [Polycladomyces subterraneus]|uniref:NarK/NasA family nitrate transporter n=1 Tax=Polycladomyces subterraneus TaxID=1016997 RepID=A0ABT8IN44_9BACL|nr:nitrate/nitrite transporter [Polycladomyces subterraneus]MDN4593549.1 NarK/NasA family nitrate transporter [Polycladomyces subterraneus]
MRSFLRAGHLPSLLSAFLYFDVSFMVWVLLGALGVMVAQDLNLNATQKGLMVAVPILGGSIFRIIMGLLTDRIGAKRTGLIGMTATMVPLCLLWLTGTNLPQVIAAGFLLGIAGASFASAIPLASRWYPPKYRGLAMGIAGAGNSGTVFAVWFAPRLAEVFGSWHAVFGLAMIPIGLVMVIFALFAKDSPDQLPAQPLHSYFAVWKEKDAWLFCFFYSVTFGGFVGFSSFLPILIHDQYGLNQIEASSFVTACVFAGSFVRPIGGWLADRVGGIRMLLILFSVITCLVAYAAQLPPFSWMMGLLIMMMMGLGMGNGAVFQLVPQRFAKEIGVITGMVGAAGGIGGFYLPFGLGALKDMTGTYAAGLWAIAAVVALAFISMWVVSRRWRREWARESVGNIAA